MIALFIGASALGAVPRSVKICVDYQVTFGDAVNSASVDGIGDHWDNNTVDRAAIGLSYELTTEEDFETGFLDTAGCMSRTVDFAGAPGETFKFEVISSTRRRGIDLHFRYNDTPVGGDGRFADHYWWEDAQSETMEWTGLTVPASGTVSHDLAFPAEDGWQFLAVATWLIHRSDWNLPDPVSWNCCVEGGAGLNGKCANQAQYGYKRDQDPYLTTQPKVFIMGLWDQGTGNPVNAECCASRLHWDAAPANTDEYVVGFAGGVDEMDRYTIAHELGHVLVGVRMGGREVNYPGDAPLDGCNGSYRPGTNPNPPPVGFVEIDQGGENRANLTKEYNSKAAREGWADWVSAWAWNAVTGSDCEFKTWSYQDFDLDDDIDNDFTGSNAYKDGTWDCLGTPELFVADSSDPTDPFLTSVNWLADVIDEARCDAFDDTDCADPALMESRNRSTVYDWHRMLYQLYKHEGLTPEQLSDLYVDMCPRAWRADDGDCSDDADLPLQRWEASGYHHWLGLPVQDRLNRVEH